MENRILKFWDDRALKKNLVCTNDDLLENFELKFLIRLIKKNSFVLDIGSGDGTLLHKLNTLKKTKTRLDQSIWDINSDLDSVVGHRNPESVCEGGD